MLRVCITFDYELFFGENYGSARDVLFDPTDKLILALSEKGVTATFFADTCSVVQHKKFGQLEYVVDFTNQICRMISNGQDVQLHIHPHWLQSEYKDNKWEYNNETYRLHSFGFDKSKEQNVYSIIKEGKDYLENTIKSNKADYQCVAFRAGGFALQPHACLVEALYENGIYIDSSVAPMLFSEGVNSYDYLQKPELVNWYISSKKDWWINSDDKKAVFEIPVATENKNPFMFLLRRLLNPNSIKLSLGVKRGTYMNEVTGNNKKISYLQYITCYNAVSMDAYCADHIYRQLKRFYKKHKCHRKDAIVAIIGHPKLVTNDYIDNMKKLIMLIKNDHRFTLTSIPEIYKQLAEDRL